MQATLQIDGVTFPLGASRLQQLLTWLSPNPAYAAFYDVCSQHPCETIRVWAAEQPFLLPETIERILADPKSSVRVKFASNYAVIKKLDEAQLNTLVDVAGAEGRAELASLAYMSELPETILLRLARDPDPSVRRELLTVSVDHEQILTLLAEDTEFDIASTAQQMLDPMENAEG